MEKIPYKSGVQGFILLSIKYLKYELYKSQTRMLQGIHTHGSCFFWKIKTVGFSKNFVELKYVSKNISGSLDIESCII